MMTFANELSLNCRRNIKPFHDSRQAWGYGIWLKCKWNFPQWGLLFFLWFIIRTYYLRIWNTFQIVV